MQFLRCWQIFFQGIWAGVQTKGIVQTNIVRHTGADGFSRLSRQAEFDGIVIPCECYIMVDDFIGQGGTLANQVNDIDF